MVKITYYDKAKIIEDINVRKPADAAYDRLMESEKRSAELLKSMNISTNPATGKKYVKSKNKKSN